MQNCITYEHLFTLSGYILRMKFHLTPGISYSIMLSVEYSCLFYQITDQQTQPEQPHFTSQ